jgi:hypothetical protein
LDIAYNNFMPNTSSSVFSGARERPAILLKEVAGDEIDGCVSCGTDTPYKKNTHIDLREHYVEGAGQLCKECWDQTYSKGDGGLLLG